MEHLDSKLIALTVIWVALRVSLSMIPTFPIFGLPGSLSADGFIAPLTGPLLGPFYGFIHGVVYGVLARNLYPFKSYFGVFSPLPDIAAGVAPGLLLYPRRYGWKILIGYYISLLITWYTYGDFSGIRNWMFLVTWEHWLAIAFLAIPKIRMFIIGEILSRRDFKRLAVSIWMLGWITRMSSNILGNNLLFYLYDFTNPIYWVPLIPYYGFVDFIEELVAAVIGAFTLIALKEAEVKVFIDNMGVFKQS